MELRTLQGPQAHSDANELAYHRKTGEEREEDEAQETAHYEQVAMCQLRRALTVCETFTTNAPRKKLAGLANCREFAFTTNAPNLRSLRLAGSAERQRSAHRLENGLPPRRRRRERHWELEKIAIRGSS